MTFDSMEVVGYARHKRTHPLLKEEMASRQYKIAMRYSNLKLTFNAGCRKLCNAPLSSGSRKHLLHYLFECL